MKRFDTIYRVVREEVKKPEVKRRLKVSSSFVVLFAVVFSIFSTWVDLSHPSKAKADSPVTWDTYDDFAANASTTGQKTSNSGVNISDDGKLTLANFPVTSSTQNQSYNTLFTGGDGHVWGSGYNDCGQLGNGNYDDQTTPTEVLGPGGVGYLDNVVAVKSGYQIGVALKNDGTVWTWGCNYSGQLGNKDNSYNNSLYPVEVVDQNEDPLTNITAISVGAYFVMAMSGDGRVWCWGSDNEGTLGNGGRTGDTNYAAEIPYLNAISISAGGYHAVALSRDGTVYTWGRGSDGQLGSGNYDGRNYPDTVGGLGPIIQIATGDAFTMALAADGTVWGWGYNLDGEMGNDTSSSDGTLSPVQVLSSDGNDVLSNIKKITCGGYHTEALSYDGTLWTWGYGGNGQIGNGSYDDRSLPNSTVTNLINGTIVDIFNGRRSGMAITDSGDVYTWGSNNGGDLGRDTGGNEDATPAVSQFAVTEPMMNPRGELSYLMAYEPDPQNWSSITWNGSALPANTYIELRVKTDNDLNSLASDDWSDPVTFDSTGHTTDTATISPGQGQYLEVSVRLISQDGTSTPEIDSISASYSVQPTNNPPDNPTNLEQKMSPGGNSITESAWTTDNTPDLSFTISDPELDNVTYQVQMATDSAFNNLVLDYLYGSNAISGSSFIYNVGQTGGTYAVGNTNMTLPDSATGYWWRVRGIDTNSNQSGWTEFGTPGVMDFKVDSTAPTGGTVYDGNNGSEHSYNDYNGGSLTALSAYWTASQPDFSVSGAPASNIYQYAIGTTAGGNNVKDWSYTGTNGTETYANATGLNLQTSQKYYFTVRAYDNAGNYETLSSAGQQVYPTLSYSLSSNQMAFATLSNANSWTDTKSVTTTVSTNAQAGYMIYGWITDYLRSTTSSSKTIADYSGTWATPTTWSGGTYGFGYTSSDSSVQGLNRYASGTKYAGFSHNAPGDILADHTAQVNGTTGSIVNEQFTITGKVTTSSYQQASTYQTGLILVVAPNF